MLYKQSVFCTSTRFSEVYHFYLLTFYMVHMNVALLSYYIIYFIIHNINIHYSIIEIIYLAKYIIIIKVFVLDICVFFLLTNKHWIFALKVITGVVCDFIKLLHGNSVTHQSVINLHALTIITVVLCVILYSERDKQVSKQ